MSGIRPGSSSCFKHMSPSAHCKELSRDATNSPRHGRVNDCRLGSSRIKMGVGCQYIASSCQSASGQHEPCRARCPDVHATIAEYLSSNRVEKQEGQPRPVSSWSNKSCGKTATISSSIPSDGQWGPAQYPRFLHCRVQIGFRYILTN